MRFEFQLEDNLFRLHEILVDQLYVPDPYQAFYVYDPKRRHIHKASVCDRVVHQAVFRVLSQEWEKLFIYDSYSSREGKGTHKGVDRLFQACRKASDNWKKTTYVLKGDIRKFFDSIDHMILLDLLEKRLMDVGTRWLVKSIIDSFETLPGKGLPLGNVTSQLFANVYLNELDQFVKHTLNVKYYFRYCDDFVLVHREKEQLEVWLDLIEEFLRKKLLLELHPHKVSLRKVVQGVDFLGYVVLPHYRLLRTKTAKRMVRKVNDLQSRYYGGQTNRKSFRQSLNSYLGMLNHCKGRILEERLSVLVENYL